MSEVGSEKGDKRRWFRRGREELDSMIDDQVETEAAPEVDPARAARRTKRSGDMFRSPANEDAWSSAAWADDDWDDDWTDSPKRTSVRAAAAPSAAKVDAWLESDSNDFADSTRDIAKKWTGPESKGVPEPGAFWDDEPVVPVLAEPVFTADHDESEPETYDRPSSGALGDLDDTGAWHVSDISDELAKSQVAAQGQDRHLGHFDDEDSEIDAEDAFAQVLPTERTEAPRQAWDAPTIDDTPTEALPTIDLPNIDLPNIDDPANAIPTFDGARNQTPTFDRSHSPAMKETNDDFDLSEFASDGDLDFDDEDDFAAQPAPAPQPTPAPRAASAKPAEKPRPAETAPVRAPSPAPAPAPIPTPSRPKATAPIEPKRQPPKPSAPQHEADPHPADAYDAHFAIDEQLVDPNAGRFVDNDQFVEEVQVVAPRVAPPVRATLPPQRSTKPAPAPVLHDDFADQDVEFAPIDYSESNSRSSDQFDEYDDDYDGRGSMSSDRMATFGQTNAFSKLCSSAGAGLLIIGAVRLLVMLMTSAIATKDDFDVVHRIGLGFNDIGSSFGLLFLLGIVLISLPTVFGDDESEHHDSRAATLLGITALACLLGVVGGIIGVRSTIQQLQAQEINVDNADWTNFIHTLLSTTGVSLVALLAAVRAISARGND